MAFEHLWGGQQGDYGAALRNVSDPEGVIDLVRDDAAIYAGWRGWCSKRSRRLSGDRKLASS